MTTQDFSLIGGGAMVTSIVVAIVKYFSDKAALRSAERLKTEDGHSSVQIAAITSFRELVAAYQTDISGLRKEMEEMRERHQESEDRHDQTEKEMTLRIEALMQHNRRIGRLYERAMTYIETQHAILLKTNPDARLPDFPRDIELS